MRALFCEEGGVAGVLSGSGVADVRFTPAPYMTLNLPDLLGVVGASPVTQIMCQRSTMYSRLRRLTIGRSCWVVGRLAEEGDVLTHKFEPQRTTAGVSIDIVEMALCCDCAAYMGYGGLSGGVAFPVEDDFDWELLIWAAFRNPARELSRVNAEGCSVGV